MNLETLRAGRAPWKFAAMRDVALEAGDEIGAAYADECKSLWERAPEEWELDRSRDRWTYGPWIGWPIRIVSRHDFARMYEQDRADAQALANAINAWPVGTQIEVFGQTQPLRIVNVDRARATITVGGQTIGVEPASYETETITSVSWGAPPYAPKPSRVPPHIERHRKRLDGRRA